MDLLYEVKKLSACKDFAESKNYYYEHHKCPETGKDIKVRMDYTLSSDLEDCILRFGICPCCGKCFYHKDFATKGF